MRRSLPRLDPGIRASLVLVVVIAAVFAPLVLIMWPTSLSTGPEDSDYLRLSLTNVSYSDCESVTDEVPCGEATGTLPGGESVTVMLFRDAWLSEVTAGDPIIAYASQSHGETVYTFHSHDRGWTLIAFTVGVIALVLLSVGGRGLRALASLIASGLFIWIFLVAGISSGGSPLAYTSVTVVLVLTGVLFFTHGLSFKTLAAWAGTMCGAGTALVAGGLLSSWLRLGPADESASKLTYTARDLDLSSLSLAALLIALIGILNDIAAAQASTVFSHAPDPRRPLLRTIGASALTVGRDHSASAIYTISFSVVGSGLAAFVLAHTYHQPLGALLQTDTVATTLTQMLAGIIGIVVTMPATTAFALLFARLFPADRVRQPAH